MSMKYLILINNSTGITDFRMELLEELLREGDVVVSTPDSGTVAEIEKLGARVINTKVDRRGINPITDFCLLKKYRDILKVEKPDMVITYTIKPNVYGGLACRIAKIPYAINITGLGTAFQGSGMLRKIVTRMYKVGCKKAKVIFFENAENQKIFIDEKIIRQEKTCLLNGAGVNLSHFHVMEYPTDNNVTRFLFIGRVMKEKGINELFSAMQKLVADGYRCSLDVLGEYEEDYKEIIERYESEGWLHYHGYQKDVRPYIKKCHCFVLPSWHEGMANTNLECAASGRPVITSNIHGCLEAVENGMSGYLCQKGNVNDLYLVMKKFVILPCDVRKAMGLAGRKHMEELFDKKIVVQKTIEAIGMR